MKEQTILHLMVKSSLLYVIRNRSYSHLKKCSRRGTLSILGFTNRRNYKYIENKSLNGEFQRYILFFISILWLAIYQLNQKDTCINNENRYRETIIIQLRAAYGTIPYVTNLGKNVENCQMYKEERQQKTKRGSSNE